MLYAYARSITDDDGRFILDYCRKNLLRFQPDPSVTDQPVDTLVGGEVSTENDDQDDVIISD